MVTLALESAGTGTLPKSGPGAYSTVTISDTEASTGDVISLTITKAVDDGAGDFDAYVSSISDGASFVVASNKRQLSDTLTFDYLIHKP